MNETFALFTNTSFVAAGCAWLLAQSIKLVNNLITTRKFDFRYLVSTGGMPSAHSAMVTALATTVGMREGLGSSLFAVTLIFALVVMFDAQSVRRAAGSQARLLNQIVDELLHEHHLSQQKLAELLGHTPLEVFLGLITGILVGVIVQIYLG